MLYNVYPRVVRKLKQVCFRTESGEGCQAKGGGQQEHILIQQILSTLLMNLIKLFSDVFKPR